MNSPKKILLQHWWETETFLSRVVDRCNWPEILQSTEISNIHTMIAVITSANRTKQMPSRYDIMKPGAYYNRQHNGKYLTAYKLKHSFLRACLKYII
ncbi:hypothetical protein A3860_37780 [Niastella vici]|uniref:Uncharacterized protein n=1 Tax=Niastella vici TaxID=1703345 RepID=A0A1V9FM93_9BACT|nr:hypothetical protein A3860_37780 [Niastella vici]